MIFDTHKRSLFRFCRGLILVGIAFGVLSVIDPESMGPAVYGARAYAIPAEAWALGFVSAAALVIFGVHINGRRPTFTPIIRLIGIAFLMGMFGYLAHSAWGAEDGEPIVIFSILFFGVDLVEFAWTDLRILWSRSRFEKYGRG
jgi:hypothetical protein